MSDIMGSNLRDIRLKNRAVILELVVTEKQVSRVDLSRKTGLTKTTAGKVVSDLIDENIICETQTDVSDNGLGRKPVYLDISPCSPCVCGMLIKRGLFSVIFADYKGVILAREDYKYNHSITADSLVEILLRLYSKLKSVCDRKIVAVGISAIGPIDVVKQQLANPPDFFGISNLQLPKIITNKIGLPTSIIHDANAGALAEKVYGNPSRPDDFIYVHIMGGIGIGYILKNQIYNGTSGMSGEIGHTSINFDGPLCHCGNTGCLEMYANMNKVNEKIRYMKKIYPACSILPESESPYTWREVVDAAEKSDFFALSALDEFCGYVSQALANVINLLDINHVIVGYDSSPEERTIVKIISEKLNSQMGIANNHTISVEKSVFGGDAPLIGSVALITNKFFEGEWEF